MSQSIGVFSSTINKKYILLFIMAFIAFNSSYSQLKPVDSLKTELNNFKAQHNFQHQDTTHIDLLNALGKELRFYKPDSLLSLSKEALKYSNGSEYVKGKMESLIGIGDYYSDKGIQEQSISHYQKAQELAKETNNIDFILFTHNCLAGEYEYKGEYALALNEYLESMEIAKEANKTKMLSILNENIALLYASQKDFEHALSYFKTVKKLNEEINDEIFIARSLSNIASIYADTGDLEYAMFNVNTSISVFEKNEELDWLAFAYQIKGKTYLKQEKYDWALFWLKQSKAIHDKKIDDKRGEIDLLHGLAEANLGKGRDSLSESYALKGFNLAQNLNIKEGVKKHTKTLYQIHKQNEAYVKALAYHELYQELSDTISKNESKKSLVMLKTQINHEQQKEGLIAESEKALGRQKNYIYASLAILLILLGITLLVRRNESIQKKLNKELNSKKNALEKQEVELREINVAKDKLFSIIGHDLRGPIGALQGLLQLFESGEIKQKEFWNFVPKLRGDIDQISFTLNNLLSWGQTQMNGTITKPSRVSLENVVTENMNLLSEIADGKSIQMINQLSNNTFAWSDADQIDIVIRNLMSNALKFTPKEGMIAVTAKEKNDFWEICVVDTGIGMNPDTQSKIFDAHSNITTYGTDNEKGTGLGLTLCKEMVENNNGTIWVESTLNQGTSFYFTVPKAIKENGNANYIKSSKLSTAT